MKRYKYPESNKIFTLDHFDNNGNAHFECGHWCTSNVFEDLIDLSTGFAQWDNPQTLLKF